MKPTDTPPSHDFYENRACKYFPCHAGADSPFNCLFCFCPLYAMPECPGNPQMLPNGIKDCSRCTWPHQKDNYMKIISLLSGKR